MNGGGLCMKGEADLSGGAIPEARRRGWPPERSLILVKLNIQAHFLAQPFRSRPAGLLRPKRLVVLVLSGDAKPGAQRRGWLPERSLSLVKLNI